MALVGINPVRAQPKKDTLDRVAQAIEIAGSILGTSLAIPKYLQDRGIAQKQQEMAERKQEMEERKSFREVEPEELARYETTQPGEPVRQVKEQAPGLVGMFRAPESSVFEGGLVVPREVAGGVELGDLEKILLNKTLQENDVVPQGTPGANALSVGDRTLYLKPKEKESKKPSLFQFHQSFEEVPSDTKGSFPIELDTGETKYGIRKKQPQQIPPEGIMKQIEELEQFFDDLEDDPKFRSNFIPVVGQFRAFFADKFRLDDPKSAEFFATMNSAILDFTKSKQGSRPSDLDLKVIKEQIFPTRGDFPEVVRAKFSGIKRMVRSMIRNPEKPVGEIVAKVAKEIGAGAEKDLSQMSTDELIKMAAGE